MSKFNSIKEIAPEGKLALFIARWVTHDNDLSKVKDLLMQERFEWKRFRGFLKYHELSSFAYPCLKKYSYLLPNEEMELLRKSYYFCVGHLSYLWKEEHST